jgi:hypothetical protein
MDDPLAMNLRQALARLAVRAWRLHLETPDVLATVPMLRGVWGKALHDLDQSLYQAIFEGSPGGTPRYVLRPAPDDAQPSPALEFILFGPADDSAEQTCWDAWESALRTGLGSERKPGRLVEVRPLAWDGTPLAPARRQPGFSLAPLSWPMDTGSGCRLVFSAPVRLMREGKLITMPTLADITVAVLRRFHAFAPDAASDVWQARHEWLDRTWTVPAAPFRGGPLDLVRYSGRQRSEIDLHGVAGELFLSEGPGLLADLLLAAQWLHVGKSTVMGLGQLRIESLSVAQDR